MLKVPAGLTYFPSPHFVYPIAQRYEREILKLQQHILLKEGVSLFYLLSQALFHPISLCMPVLYEFHID